MDRCVDMMGCLPPNDGVQSVGGRVGCGSIRYRFTRVRPVFMEPLVVGVPPGGMSPSDGNYVRLVRGGEGGRCGALKKMRKKTSFFPLKEDSAYIGYLTDDDESGSSGSGEEGDMSVTKIVERRRRELLGTHRDMSFSTCMFMMVTACGLLLLLLFAASPWGVPPPKRL
jgi:hypothetical protein